jgi:hypothetical protein
MIDDEVLKKNNTSGDSRCISFKALGGIPGLCRWCSSSATRPLSYVFRLDLARRRACQLCSGMTSRIGVHTFSGIASITLRILAFLRRWTRKDRHSGAAAGSHDRGLVVPRVGPQREPPRAAAWRIRAVVSATVDAVPRPDAASPSRSRACRGRRAAEWTARLYSLHSLHDLAAGATSPTAEGLDGGDSWRMSRSSSPDGRERGPALMPGPTSVRRSTQRRAASRRCAPRCCAPPGARQWSPPWPNLAASRPRGIRHS